MTKPISPSEIASAKRQQLPEAVFTVVNKLLAANFVGGRATILQKDIVAELIATGMTEAEIFGKCYLNFEDAYEAEGWSVYYDKPAYNESYDATFTFKARRNRSVE